MYHFIYPSKDAYIYELNDNSEKNFGGDNTLVLKKEFDTDTLKGVSRVLLQFDLAELSQSIVSNEISSSAKYYLRLYEQKTSELSPEYSLATFPLSSSWEDGTGYTTQDPNSRNGVSWLRTDESFDNTNWVLNGIVQNSSSLYFGGNASDDYVDLRNGTTPPTGWPLGSSTRTITAWIKPSAVNAAAQIFSYGTPEGGKAFNFRQFQQHIQVDNYNGPDIKSDNCLTVDTWTHVATTFNGDTGCKLYANGVDVTQEIDTFTSNPETDTTMGAYFSTIGATHYSSEGSIASEFDGNIDEVALFNVEKTPTEILSIYNSGKPTDLSSESGLVGYWRFEGNANDLSSNSNDGTVTNAVFSESAPYSQSFYDAGIVVESGSRTAGGGVWYINSGECSQSFSYESPDVNMDVTDMVNNWLDGTVSNNGLILKWSGSQEDSSTETGDINFFSSNANSIYSPKIEVRWDEQTNDYDGTFEDYDEEFEEGTGTFEYPDVPIDPVTIDGTDDNYMFMIGLRKTYKETEKPRFRIAGRERYQPKTVSTTKTTQKNKLVPHGSGSYSILDVETGATLIPFGEHSLLSTDLYSNYFKLKLDGFINNRSYRILLRLRLNDGRYRIFDKSYDFKVIN